MITCILVAGTIWLHSTGSGSDIFLNTKHIIYIREYGDIFLTDHKIILYDTDKQRPVTGIEIINKIAECSKDVVE